MRTFFVRWGPGLKSLLYLSGICVPLASIASAEVLQSGWGDFSLRISASAFNRTIGGATFTPGSNASESDAPSISSGVGGRRANVGPENKYANRIYDDGYVGMDLLTSERGDTRKWGVEHSSQVRNGVAVMTASDGTQFSSQGHQTTQTGGESTDGGSESFWGSSLQIEAIYAQSETTSWGLFLGLSTVGMSQENTATSFSDEQQWQQSDRKIVDTFSVQGNTLHNIPSSRALVYVDPTEHTLRTYNVVDEKLSFDLQTVSLGVSRERMWKWFVFQAAGGPTVNFVSADSSRRESVLTSQDGGPSTLISESSDSSRDRTVLAGAFAQGSASLKLGRLARMSLVGRYDVAQEYKGGAGPSTYTADLNGFTVAASVGWDL
jgi:hypothetical protein